MTDNETIAEFHGWIHKPTPKGKGKGHWDFTEWGKACWNSDGFRYHDSFDWLMPVWYKFKELKCPEPYQDHWNKLGEFKRVVGQAILHHGPTPSEACRLLAEGIRWYNTINK